MPNVAENNLAEQVTVLIAEDNAGLNQIIRRVLADDGFQTAQALTGAAALENIAAAPNLILLLDYVLPDMRADELIATLTAQHRDVPFIIMTGQGDEQTAVDMMKLGARDCLIKQGNFVGILPQMVRKVCRLLAQEKRLQAAEAAQRESERRFREMLENVNLLALMLDAAGQIIFCNDYLLDLTGWQRADALGQDWFCNFLPPEIRQTLQAAFSNTLSTGSFPIHYENDILTKRGERRRIAWTNTPLRDARGRVSGMNCLGEDITGRKRTEAQLHQLQQAVEAMPLGMTVTDLDGAILYANPAVARMHGYRPEELLGRDARLLAPPELRRPVALAEVKQWKGLNRESVNLRQDGQRFPTWLKSEILRDPHGEPVALVTTCEDITERKRAEESLHTHRVELEMQYAELLAAQRRLRESHEKYANLYDFAPVGYCTLDPHGSIVEANLTAATLLGVARAQLLNTRFYRYVAKEERDRLFLHLRQFSATATQQVCELRLARPDGSEFQAQLDTMLVQASAAPPHYRTAISDITLRKQAEAQLRDREAALQIANTQLREAQRVAGLGSWTHLPGQALPVWTDEMFRLFGLDPRQGVPSVPEFRLLIHPDQRPGLDDALNAALATGQGYALELRVTRPDGAARIIDLRTESIREQIPYMVGTAQDITDRKRAEEELRTYREQLEELVSQRTAELVAANVRLQTEIAERQRADAELRQQNAQMHALFAAMPDLVLHLKRDGTVVDAYASQEEPFDAPRAMLLGRNLQAVLPAEMLERVFPAMASAFTANELVTFECVLPGKRAPGREFEMRLSAYGPEDCLALVRDITEQKQRDAIVRIQRDLATLLSSTSDQAVALRQILQAACQLEGVDCGGVYLVDSQTGAIDLAAHQGLPASFVAEAAHYAAETPNARLIKTGQRIYRRYDDIRPTARPEATGEGLRALAVIPIWHDRQVIGGVNLASHTQDDFSPTIRLGIEAIATQLGGMLARIRVENAFRESQQNLQTLFDTLDDFLFILDSNGQIVNTNPVVQTRLGYTADELRRMNVLEVHPPDRRAEAAGIVADMLAGRAQYCPVPLCAKDGTLIPVETKVSAGTWNKQAGLFGISRDITERKQAEVALHRAKEAADAANRAKSQFLANMSHELRTPLNAVLGYAQILQDGGANLNERQREGLKTIQRSGEYLLQLINTILDLAKIEAGRMELVVTDVHLPEFLKQITEMMRMRAEQKGLAFLDVFDPNIPAGIRADEQRLRQVLLNLLGNAIKFTEKGNVALRVKRLPPLPPLELTEVGFSDDVSPKATNSPPGRGRGGFLPLSAGLTPGNPPLPLPGGESGGFAAQNPSLSASLEGGMTAEIPTQSPLEGGRGVFRFEVEDTGVGIAPEELAEIFLPFHQVGDARYTAEGTGLGLPISRKLVELMGGELQMRSLPGQGSVFWFEIPVLDLPDFVPYARLAAHKIIGYQGARRRVLITDDQRDNRSILNDMLLPLGFHIAEAENGQACLAYARKEPPDVILLDLRMPGLDGFEVARRLKHGECVEPPIPSPQPCPVIIGISASAHAEIRARSLAAGCDDFLAKPFQKDDLLAQLQRHLHLAWVYERDPDAPADRAVQPASAVASYRSLPPEARARLRQQAERGNVKGVLAELDAIERLGDRFLPLVGQLRRMAKQFQMDEIVALLEAAEKQPAA